MTNVLFLVFYFAMIFPAGFFWASATLVIIYWVDKFCLLRTWAPTPMLGTAVADYNRVSFVPLVLIAYGLMSSYNFASFPYDNACHVDDTVPANYLGSFTAHTASGQSVIFTTDETLGSFKYCNQDMLRYHPPAFPAIPSNQPKGDEWMSTEQAQVATVLGKASVAVIAVVVLVWLSFVLRALYRFFFGRGYCSDETSDQGFSEIHDIYGYIPQFKLSGALFPTLVCDTSEVSYDLIDFHDPTDPSFKSHNAAHDVPGLVHRDHAKSLFSIVREWKPNSPTS